MTHLLGESAFTVPRLNSAELEIYTEYEYINNIGMNKNIFCLSFRNV